MITCEVCGDEFLPAYPSQEQCSNECRKAAKKKPAKRRGRPAGFLDDQKRCRVTGCTERAVHQHHVIYEQHLDDYGGDVGDARNALALCELHHTRHHRAKRRVLVSELRPENVEFAHELLGAAADLYLERYYAVA